MSNDLEYSLGINLSPLTQAGMAIGKWGDSISKELNRRFSAGDIFKGIMQGIGIGSVQQVAERLVEPFKESAESAQRIAEYTEQAADATERLLALRRTDAQQLDALEKQMRHLKEDANAAAPIGFVRGVLGSVAGQLGLGGLSSKLLANGDANAEKQAKNAAEQAKLSLAIEVQKKQIVERRNADELKAINEAYKTERDRKAALERLDAFDREARRAKMTDEEKLVDLQQEKAAYDRDIAISAVQQREGMKLTQQGAEELLDKKQKQEALEKRIAEITERKAKAEALIGSTTDSNIEKWREFVGVINSVGRGDKDLSDAEIEKKIANINRELAQRRGASLGRYQGQAGTPNYDFFGVAQQSNLANALAEQRLREQTRRNVQAFGEERAFQLFDDSAARFEQVLRGYQTSQDKVTSALEKLNNGVDLLGATVKQLGARNSETGT